MYEYINKTMYFFKYFRNVMNKFKIKTSCGIDKFNNLREKQGLLNKLRLYWFVFFAVIRDYKK